MIGPAPEVRWGKKYVKVDKAKPDSAFNYRLTPDATDREKYEFECYTNAEMGGEYFLTKMFPKMKEPYYTWEGKTVERSSLKGRKIPTAKKRQMR